MVSIFESLSATHQQIKLSVRQKKKKKCTNLILLHNYETSACLLRGEQAHMFTVWLKILWGNNQATKVTVNTSEKPSKREEFEIHRFKRPILYWSPLLNPHAPNASKIRQSF